jgi:uncharacterized membrane protein YgdD (TMEM256/DUF423 family)
VRSSKGFFVTAALFGFVAVGLGAFGAHALKSVISADMLSIFETGVRYQMYHALALLCVSWALQKRHDAILFVSAWFFVVGVVLFSGSLYALSLTGMRAFGILTPFGGLSFMGGWFMMAWGFWKRELTS